MFDQLSGEELRQKLQDAIENRMIVPYYQPIVRNLTNQTVALEKLPADLGIHCGSLLHETGLFSGGQ